MTGRTSTSSSSCPCTLMMRPMPSSRSMLLARLRKPCLQAPSTALWRLFWNFFCRAPAFASSLHAPSTALWRLSWNACRRAAAFSSRTRSSLAACSSPSMTGCSWTDAAVGFYSEHSWTAENCFIHSVGMLLFEVLKPIDEAPLCTFRNLQKGCLGLSDPFPVGSP